jgi:hypothetical protein
MTGSYAHEYLREKRIDDYAIGEESGKGVLPGIQEKPGRKI